MFKKSCFIRKNTPELRRKLKELGYSFPSGVSGKCIATSCVTGNCTCISEAMFYDDNPHSTWNIGGRLDCGDNEELFLAVAALRTDSNINQWFVCKEEYISTHTMELVKVGTWQLNTKHNKLPYGLKRLWKKATLTEIKKHFK